MEEQRHRGRAPSSSTTFIRQLAWGPEQQLPEILDQCQWDALFPQRRRPPRRAVGKQRHGGRNATGRRHQPGGRRPYPTQLTNVNGVLILPGPTTACTARSCGKAMDPPSAPRWSPTSTRACPSSSPSYLTNVNGTLFFAANDGVHGEQLWRSSGSAVGTSMVADINPAGAPGAVAVPDGRIRNPIEQLVNVNGTLFFVANDGTHGFELWQSNGTAVGTMMVHDINPGPGSSYPFDLTNANGTLFFQANDGVDGSEPWILVPPASPPATPRAGANRAIGQPALQSDSGLPCLRTASKPRRPERRDARTCNKNRTTTEYRPSTRPTWMKNWVVHLRPPDDLPLENCSCWATGLDWDALNWLAPPTAGGGRKLTVHRR